MTIVLKVLVSLLLLSFSFIFLLLGANSAIKKDAPAHIISNTLAGIFLALIPVLMWYFTMP